MAHRLGKRIAAPVGTQAFGSLPSAGKDHPVRKELLAIGTNDKSFGGTFQASTRTPVYTFTFCLRSSISSSSRTEAADLSEDRYSRPGFW